MDTSAQQLVALNRKLDILYDIIVQLNERLVSEVPDAQPLIPPPSIISEPNLVGNPQVSQAKSELEHKDVLSDDSYLEVGMVQREEPSLTTDIQIQRLTAQLTAAYNRIAALEEQLLSKRMNRVN
ncbi:MAG: hypothetical protein ACFBSC_18145 [Microcoleaceae cyanobacterium]